MPPTHEASVAGEADPRVWRAFWNRQIRSKGILHLAIRLLRKIYAQPTASHIARYCRSAAAIGTHRSDKPAILEVGCGSAAISRAVMDLVPAARVMGLDIASEPFPLARRRLPDIWLAIADARALPIASCSFDLILSIGLVEHFSRETALDLVLDMKRVTRRGGVLALTVPSLESPMDWIRRLMGSRYPFGVEYPFTRDEFGKLLESAGLERVETRVILSSRLLALGRKP
jgi:SAM-dependent methyltransferase